MILPDGIYEIDTPLYRGGNKETLRLGFDDMTSFPTLQSLAAVIAPGSTAFCLNTTDAYMLKNDGSWQLL